MPDARTGGRARARTGPRRANEDLPYCVFVSSKVSKDKKNPLIISLHGLGIGPGFMCRGKALDLAEEGGYILAAPMGYNVGGWYGSPVMQGRGRAGGTPPPPPPPNLAEWSEKDVDHEYKEYPGVTHGPIIEAAMPDIFAFFAKHTKAGR